MLERLRPCIAAMAGYVPGEQPRESDVLKLNTNESPYPPSPRVFEAIRAALTAEKLRKYPDATGVGFRRAAARILDVDPDGIVIGNGSDDILTILTRAFVPESGLVVSPTPSYLLYRSLAELQGARFATVPFTIDWTFPNPWPIGLANLLLLPNPNSPSGTCVSLAEIDRLTYAMRGPIVVDEAYADFADFDAIPLARTGKVIVTRT